MPLDRDAAIAVLREKLAEPLGLSVVILKPEQFRVVIEFHRE